VGFVLHTFDHFRRGVDSVTPHVFWLGMLSSFMAIVGVTMALRGHRLAAEAAVAVGLPVAIGVSAVHLLPHWGVLSDPLLSGGMAPITWIAVFMEIVGAAAFGFAGLRLLRRPSRVAVAR
jgi:hypothetical protein